MKIDLTNTPTAANTAQALSMLMGSSNKQDIKQIPPEQLIPYPDQPFKPYNPDKLQELAEDIKENGILSPVVVRSQDSGMYQILSGHNRTNAGKLAGLTSIPCIIMDVDDATAELIMVNSNLNQRHELLPSEKAFAYKIQMDNAKMQGKRTLETKLDTGSVIGEHCKESRANIFRYIRLTFLIPDFLKLVDEETLPFRVGVNLSYISIENQERLSDYISVNDISVSIKQSEQLKEMGDFSDDVLEDFFSCKKSAKPKQKKIALNRNDLDEFFNEDVSDKEIGDTIIKALKGYFNLNKEV